MFASYLSPIILLWIKFRGHGKPVKFTKIHFLRICNLAYFFKVHFPYPVKHPSLEIDALNRINANLKSGVKISFGLFISAE